MVMFYLVSSLLVQALPDLAARMSQISHDGVGSKYASRIHAPPKTSVGDLHESN